MTTELAPICFMCKHLHEKPYHNRYALQCEAYPKGIPKAITFNKFIHTEPRKGDRGVTFELDPTFKDFGHLVESMKKGT